MKKLHRHNIPRHVLALDNARKSRTTEKIGDFNPMGGKVTHTWTKKVRGKGGLVTGIIKSVLVAPDSTEFKFEREILHDVSIKLTEHENEIELRKQMWDRFGPKNYRRF